MKQMRPLLLSALLLLMAGCQAQSVKPDTAAQPQAPRQDALQPLQQRFDQMVESNDQVQQRITLMQEQVIKLNQQMQVLQQRNLQLLQGLQQMQLQQSRARQAGAQAASEENQDPLQPQLEALLQRLELLLDEQGAGARAAAAPASASAGFKLVSAYTPKGQWVIFKYDELTGLSWIAENGGWKEINELQSMPRSVYQVVLRPAAGDVKGYVAARIDRETGDTWWLKGNSWEAFQ